MTAPHPPVAGSRVATLCAQAAVALMITASVVVLSLFFDATLATAAEGLPQDAVAWGNLISDIGVSDYMFAISGLLAIVPLLARSLLRTHRFDVTLTLLAERSSYIFTTLAASAITSQIIKHLVGRARPWLFESFGPYHFDLLSMKNALASFPSGHATTAFAMAVALSLLAPSLRVALFTLALAIATSRIVVQAHYLSDITAGGLLGTVLALLVAHWFAKRRIAFVRDGDRLALKGPSLVGTALSGRPGHAL